MDWNLTPLLKTGSKEEIQKDIEKTKEANEAFANKWKNQPDYLKKPKILKQALEELENLQTNFGQSGNAGFYFALKSYINQTDPGIKANLNKIEEVEKELSNKRMFFTLNLAKVSEEKQKEFLSSSELKEYKHFLEIIFVQSKHALTDPEEKILSLKETVAHDNWERMTSGILAKQEKQLNKETKNFSELLNLIKDKDKITRDKAAEAINEILKEFEDIAEAEINSILANKKINDRLRNFKRPDEARHLYDDIPTAIVDTLIKTVTEKFEISKEFYKLKAKFFKQPKLTYAEKAILPNNEGLEYTFEQALEIVKETFSELDEEFTKILESYIKNNQIDSFPKKGKQNGAFCIHQLKKHPTYILLNFDKDLRDVTTIAHEVGHGINSELMKQNQNSLNLGTPKSTAEVASTFMEDFVLEKIIETATEEQKLSILMEKLDSDISSVFRQTAFYNFETELHTKFREKGHLSKTEIGKMFRKHMDSYLGEAIDTTNSENWWMYVPHFRYIFYVYSYVSGQLISKTLQEKTREDKKFILKVKEFLSAGTSNSPENIFRKMEVDITKKQFWKKGIGKIRKNLQETEELAKKLNKI